MQQFSRIKLSSRTQNYFSQIKHKTGLTPNILARYAICLSLKDKTIPNPEEYDENGMEINPSVLFGEYEYVYMALFLNRLHQDGLDPKIHLNKMVKSHINRGAVALWPRIGDLSDFYELVKEEHTQMEMIKTETRTEKCHTCGSSNLTFSELSQTCMDCGITEMYER